MALYRIEAGAWGETIGRHVIAKDIETAVKAFQSWQKAARAVTAADPLPVSSVHRLAEDNPIET